MKKAAILGYGNIGNGVAQVFEKNKDVIREKIGEEIEIKYVLDLRDFPGDFMEKKVVHDISVIVEDPEISVVCETMGGNEPAFTFSKMLLEAGKSVCTSNKELVANHGPELLQIAKEHQCNYLFEASVGGGIPIIRALNSSLSPEKILSVTGILNGTTNYMLTEMAEKGTDYDTVLKQAQELGYAERNPEADVEGYDSGRKIAILSSLMAGKSVKFENVHTEGITKVTAEDFRYAKMEGMSIKLLANGKLMEDGSCVASVAPCMLPASHPLAGVSDVFNAIYVTGNLLGDTMYYGRGAGKLPTASAVVADMIDCILHKYEAQICRWTEEVVAAGDFNQTVKQFFFRVKDADCKMAESIFGDLDEIDAQIAGEKGFLTGKISEEEFAEKIQQLSVLSYLRVAE